MSTQPLSVYTRRPTPRDPEALPDYLTIELQNIQRGMKNPSSFTNTFENILDFGAVGNGVTDDTAAITRAIAAGGVGGTIYFPAGTYLVTGLTANVASQTWVLSRAATLFMKAATNATVVTVSANDVTVDGGIVDGNRTNQSSDGHGFVVTGDRFALTNTKVQNAYKNGVYLSGSANSTIRGCWVTGNRLNGIFGEKNTTDCLVTGNRIDTTDGATSSEADCIVFHATTSSEKVDRCIITDNRLTPGTSSFGIEVGAFSGDTVVGAVVEGNTIVAGETITGGMSFDTCTDGVISGNTVEANGQTVSIAGIEIVSCSRMSITGNTIRGGTTTDSGLILDKSSDCVVSGNAINGWTNSSGKAGIKVSVSSAASARRNVITGNHITAPASGAVYAVRVQANHASAVVSDNLIVGNQCSGNSVASSVAVYVELNTGTNANTSVQSNTFSGWATGVEAAGATNVWCANQTTISVTTAVATSSSGTLFQETATVTPSALAAGSTNDYNPGIYGFLRLSANGGGSTLSGIANGSAGVFLTLVNLANTLTITNEDAASTAANRIITGTGASLTVAADDTVQMVYDGTTARWRVLNQH